MRLVSYIRVSKVAGREGDRFQSPDQQRDAIAHIIALSNADIVEEVIDLDESGGTMDRPGLKRALAMLDRGEADGIVVARLDRFGRNLEVPLIIEGLVESGKVFLSAADQFDTGTPMGRFALGMMALVAKLERDRHIETWGNSTRRAILRGVAINVPYGYARGPDGRLQPVEPAAGVVRKMFELRAAGHGVAAIAATLDADGIGPPRAADWTRQTVRAMLRVRTYLGEAAYGETVTADAHPAIVDTQTWQAAQTARGVSRPSRDANLLAGILRCAGCGYLMGAGTGRGGRRYSCNRVHGGGRCPSPTAAMAPRLEAHVTDLFLARYGDVVVTAAQAPPALHAHERGHAAAGRVFAACRDDAELRDALGSEHYRAGLLARHQRVEAAGRAHAAAVRGAGAQSLVVDPDVWEALTIARRRLVLAAGIDDILLRRAANTRVPIAERCVVRWTGEGQTDVPRQGVAFIR